MTLPSGSSFSTAPSELQEGIQTLIGKDHASRLYGHPLVSTLAKEKKLPSYIGSGTFASVLVDLLGHDENGKPVVAGNGQGIRAGRQVSDDAVLGPALRALSNAGAETVADLRHEIAAWFDEGMNRVSGWYQRQAQLIIFVIGAVVSRVGQREHRPCRPGPVAGRRAAVFAVAQQAVAASSDAETADSLRVPDDILESFPLGWEGEDPFGRDDGLADWGCWGWIAHLFGWLFTAAAVSLGAPFWFDLLSRVARLRGTGGRPGGVQE